MRKTKNAKKLALSPESIRILTDAQMAIAAGGCPTGSWPSAADLVCPG